MQVLSKEVRKEGGSLKQVRCERTRNNGFSHKFPKRLSKSPSSEGQLVT